MPIINRAITDLVLQDMEAFPAVYVNGPRQAGKNTLVRELVSPHFPQSQYVTFDDILERGVAARNPLEYLKNPGLPLVIDEVQMVPELFRPLKKTIDEARLTNLKSGRAKPNGLYLLTGSANLAAVPALANAMVGRMGLRTLYPLSAAEVWGGKGDFIQRLFHKDFADLKRDHKTVLDALNVATFPELLNMKPAEAKSWLSNYIRKVTLEDPRQIYNMEKADYMPLLLQALAQRAGNLTNDADLSRDVGLTSVTARTYRNLLQSTFVTLDVRPWHRNVGKRFVKSNKGYFCDTRLLCHVLQRSPEDLLKHDPGRFGHVLENFAATELLKLIQNSGAEHHLLFYRTRDGRKVDFVIESPQGALAGVEVKYAENISERDLLGLRELQSIAGKDFLCGIILCNTPRVLSLENNIYLVPFSALWQ